MGHNNKSISRRKALSLLGQGGVTGFLAQHPMKILFTALLEGHSQKLMAQSEGITPRNYLAIRLAGAPPRWTWDPLHPYDNASLLIPNAQVGTRFVSNGSKYIDVEYASTLINGVNMPWMWQFDLPRSSGGNRPMSELMDNMLVISGTDTNNPAHSGARLLQDFPLGIKYSLGSLPADQSSFPLPFINMNGNNSAFSSAKGLAPINLPVSNNNLLEDLLNPFLINPGIGFNKNKNSLSNMLSSVFASLNSMATNEHISSESLILSQSSAEELIQSGFSDIAVVYPALKAKYEGLIAIAADPFASSLNGLSAQEIGDTEDLRTAINTVKEIRRMAEQFAVVEYVFKNNLCPSMTIVPQAFPGFNFDEHNADAMSSLAACTFWNRGLAACLLELIDQLKASGIYNNTIIHVGGEFGRNPKNDATGSDHCPQSSSNTFFGGALPGANFIGNTVISSPQSNYLGTWGYMGSNLALSNNPSAPIGYLNLGHLAASIATMLKVPSPVTATPTILEENNGQITSLLPSTKLV
jgi:hypothetical protein